MQHYKVNTNPQFSAILAIVGACVENNIDVRIRAGVSFITELPLAVIPRCVEDRRIAKVKGLIYDVLGIWIW